MVALKANGGSPIHFLGEVIITWVLSITKTIQMAANYDCKNISILLYSSTMIQICQLRLSWGVLDVHSQSWSAYLLTEAKFECLFIYYAFD